MNNIADREKAVNCGKRLCGDFGVDFCKDGEQMCIRDSAYIAQKGAKGDKDRDGKTIALSASKNKKRAIDAAAKDLTTAQKRKLYEAFGVSEKVW